MPFRSRDEKSPIVWMCSQRRAYARKELNRARTVSGGVTRTASGGYQRFASYRDIAVICDLLAAGLQHSVPDAICCSFELKSLPSRRGRQQRKSVVSATIDKRSDDESEMRT